MAIEFKSPTVAKNTITDRLEKQGREAKLQEKSVEYTENNDYQVLPDEGFDGMTKVNVSVDVAVPTVQNSKTVNINTNGTKTISPDAGYDVVEQVVVNTNVQPNLQEKTVNVLLSETSTNVRPDSGFDGMSSVTVNHPPVESNTAYTATSNGSYTIHPSEGFDATTSVNLTVNVPTSGTLDINTPGVSMASTTKMYPKDFTGWDTLKDGSYKCAYCRYTEDPTESFISFNLPAIENATGMFAGTNIQNFSGSGSQVYVRINPACKDITMMFYQMIGPLGRILLEDSNARTLYFTNVITADFAFSSQYPHWESELIPEFVEGELPRPFAKISSGKRMFYNTDITRMALDLSGLEADITASWYSPFDGADELVEFRNTKYNNGLVTNSELSKTIYFDSCSKLSQASVNQILETLADQTSNPKSITFASTQYGYITEEQKAAATAKGWTIKSA